MLITVLDGHLAGDNAPEQKVRLSMSWQEGVAVALVLFGLGAGVFLVAQRLSFWLEFATRLGKALVPLAWRFVSKRMPPAGGGGRVARGVGRDEERRSCEDTRELYVRIHP